MAKFSRRAPATASASEWVNLPHRETAENGNDVDIGMNTDTDTGIDTDSDTGIGTGIDTGIDTGSDTGIGSDTGADISSDTGRNASTDAIPEGRPTQIEASTSASSRVDASPSEGQSAAPWEKFDRRAACKKFFNLRLTEFHWAVLVHLHEEEDGERSIQKIIHDILLPEIERRVGIEPRKKRLPT